MFWSFFKSETVEDYSTVSGNSQVTIEVAIVLAVLKSRTKTAKFTNMIIARFREQISDQRK